MFGVVFPKLSAFDLVCGVFEFVVVTEDGQLRKRRSGMTHADGYKNARKIVTFDVQLVDSMTTDFHDKDPYQNCAAFSPDGTKIATGGADGFIRLWKVSQL